MSIRKYTMIKGLSLLTFASIITSCSQTKYIDPSNSSNQTLEANGSCSVTQEANGATINCPDGSQAFVPNGANGANGSNGTNGSNGLDGINGTDGSSCSVQDLGNKALLSCTDGTMALIEDGNDGTNGQNGTDGQNGQDGESAPLSAYSIAKLIDPCGPQTAHDELLIQFTNGDILAHYSDGAKQHYTLLPAGSYQTTDGTNCSFKVTADKKVIW